MAPGTGRRRAGTCLFEPGPGRESDASSTTTGPLPAPRSPYSRDADTALDGAASPLARPYLVAVEREQARQSRRRLALVLAADFGIDLDRHVVGGEQVVAC
ncbi:hypothetical protein [Streptomyces europaeiscabiei]|uniref:hypothetical protein n=1 Tax=Streptomyces europaeiscabiei TaxID=146819 RepID=UPI0029A208BB|nr:hypothetical protein [Streptomyces europaeiscabiei]MDX3618151.1 hypothetical protein [Streptomyces europaeiscabiei]